MTTETTRTGGCLCGAVRFTVRGEPYKSGLCHCTTAGTSPARPFSPMPIGVLIRSGEVSTYSGRSFCTVCGSRVFSLSDHQVEIYLGSLDDAPNGIAPVNEGWTIRREHWQREIAGAGQFWDPA